MSNPHDQLLLFEQPDREDGAAPAQVDVSFLHKSFCVAGLPLRRLKDPMGTFSRNDDRFALTINPHKFMLPGGTMVEVGVPHGCKARLLIVWAATEVRDPGRRAGDRWLEIGRIKDWLSSIGITPKNGKDGSLVQTKDQLVRLAFAQFTMVLKGANSESLFKRDNLIEGGSFPENDLELYAKDRIDLMKWPQGIELSHVAYDRFTNHGIPVPTSRLAKIAHSAMAIDIFLFLCYRLPLIPPGEEELVSWRHLIAQFGSNEAPSKFRENFTSSIRNALDAYPEANVDLTPEGLRLRYSDPAELRRAFIALPGKNTTAQKVKRLRYRAPKPTEESLPLS